MKSVLRLNGKETIVENVAPIHPEFNEALVKEMNIYFPGITNDNLALSAFDSFGKDSEQSSNFCSAVINGQAEGFIPVKVEVNDLSIPAFIGFFK